MLLVSHDASVRLAWSGEKKPVAVPAGAYHMRNFRVERKHGGVEWFISGTAAPGPKVEVKEGEDTKLEIDETVRLDVSARRARGKIHFGFTITGHEGMGLSVVKDEALPIPAWSVVRGDQKLAGGDCAYG